MLPVSGQITMNMIKAELGFSESVNLHLKVRLFNGVKQIFINNGWFNLNMCSPNLPPHGGQLRIKDFYGYNHTAVCCTPPSNVKIHAYNTSGGGIASVGAFSPGENLNFYVTWEGSQNNVIIVWENSWFLSIDAGQGTTMIQSEISADPNINSAFLKVTVKNLCGQASKQIGITHIGQNTGPCNAPTSVLVRHNNSTANVQIPANTNTQLTFNVSFFGTGSGTTGLNATYNWEYWGEVGFNGQNTTTSQATFNLPPNASGWVRCIVSNPCGTVASNVINIIAGSGGTSQFGNLAQTATVSQNCPSGQVGSIHTKTIPANTYYADTLGDANTMAYNEAVAQATAERNAIGTCTVIGSCPMVINSVGIVILQGLQPNGSVIYNPSNPPVLQVTINITGSGFVTITDTAFNISEIKQVVNGNNTFSFNHPPTTYSAAFVQPIVYIQNSDYCTFKSAISNNGIDITYPQNDPPIWSNVGSPYCVGTDLMQDQQDQYGNNRTVIAQSNSSSCQINNQVDFGVIDVGLYNDLNNTLTTRLYINNSGTYGQLKLRYNTGTTFNGSWNPPIDYTVNENSSITVYPGRWNTGTDVTFRLWFDNGAVYEDRTIKVLATF